MLFILNISHSNQSTLKTIAVFHQNKMVSASNLSTLSAMSASNIWGDGTYYIISFCVHKSFGTQFEW